jgi:hypothetical protein
MQMLSEVCYLLAIPCRGTSLIDYVRALDFTAATILDRFQNSSSASAVERVLKVMASEKAKELIAVCVVFLHELIWH